MKSKPLISIVTTCKNSLPYLKESIDSVLTQDYPHIELVIQDGGSTDGSLKLIQKFARECDRGKINWQTKPDRSETEGLDRAFKRARGDILLVLNSDDVLLPGACAWGATQMQRFLKPAVIYGDTYIINNHGTVTEWFSPTDYDFAKLLCVELVPPTQAAFIRRQALQNVGLYIDTSITVCPDYELWIRLGHKFTMKYVPGFVVSKYRYFHKPKSAALKEIDESVQAKRTIMKRLFRDPQTPATINNLKPRAYRGLNMWAKAAKTKINHGPPLVSIVTPCYNNVQFISACIESVHAQDYENVEHIIQDGASTDGTAQILKKYERAKYHGLHIFSEPDRSQNEGLSKALAKVRGDILLVLNADDELLPNACSWGVEKLAQNAEFGAIYGDEYIIDDTGKIIGIHIGKEPYLYERLFCVELVPPAQAAFIRTNMLKKVGLWADTTISTCPDYEMWVRLGASFPLKHEFGIISKYRHHDLSGSRRPDMTEKLVTAKLAVINRVLKNPHSPMSIKQLRFRAYGGLYHWGAHVAGGIGLYRLSLYYLLLSFIYRPKFSKTIEIAKFLSRHVPNYVKTATKRIFPDDAT